MMIRVLDTLWYRFATRRCRILATSSYMVAATDIAFIQLFDLGYAKGCIYTATVGLLAR